MPAVCGREVLHYKHDSQFMPVTGGQSIKSHRPGQDAAHEAERVGLPWPEGRREAGRVVADVRKAPVQTWRGKLVTRAVKS